MNPEYPYKNLIKVKPIKIESLFPSCIPEEAIDLVVSLLTYDPT